MGSSGPQARASRILAFDTSAAQCAAALLEGESIVARRVEVMARGQAERLLPLLEDCLAEADLGWRDLDALAVCTGPGNFTGVRLSVAAARGLALSSGLRAIGVSAFEALAAGQRGPCLALLRNPRGAPHAQFFQDGVASSEIATTGAFRDLPGDTICVGHEACETARSLGLASHLDMIAPEPAHIAIAARARLGDPPSRPAPLYLRPADAAPSAPPPVLLDEA